MILGRTRLLTERMGFAPSPGHVILTGGKNPQSGGPGHQFQQACFKPIQKAEAGWEPVGGNFIPGSERPGWICRDWKSLPQALL